MEESKNVPRTSSKENSAPEESEGRTASILNKSSKSREITKSVSFSFFEYKNEINNNDEEDPSKSYSESDSLKVLSNVDGTMKTNQSYSSSANTPTQQNSRDILSSNSEIGNANNEERKEISNYFGWDGCEARLERDHDSRESTRKNDGISPSSAFSNELLCKDDINAQNKIKHLMEKYNDLMLVKRVESKKQVIVEQGKLQDDIDTIKTRTKNTRYYITPLMKGNVNKQKEEDDGEKLNSSDTKRTSLHSDIMSSDNMSVTKKTSKTQAKREVHEVIRPAMKNILEEVCSDTTISKNQRKCQKLSLKNIREYVNAQSMTPDERKLHEIIKIENIPRINREANQAESKYIINLPQYKPKDGTSVNVIKIKEKRKLKFQSLEDVREKTTEIHYAEGTPTKQERITLNELSRQEHRGQTVGKTVKSPTETKTFKVTSQITPCITPFVEEEKKETDKVLLIQYDKKSHKNKSKGIKQAEYTTKLLGVRRPSLGEREEMYMYEAETCGEKQKEYATKVECVQPTLKEKLNAIFDELKEFSPKTETLKETSYSDIQDKLDQSCQRPSEPIGTDMVSVQATPEMKSIEVQVRQSQILCPSSALVIAPHPSLISDLRSDKMASTNNRLEKAAHDLVPFAQTESHTTNEQIIKKESLEPAVDKTEQIDKDDKIPEFDEEKFLDIDDIRQRGQSLDTQAKGTYAETENKLIDEFTPIEQLEEGKDTTDVSSVKSVINDEANRADEFNILHEVPTDSVSDREKQDTIKDEERVTAEVFPDLERPDKSGEEIIVQENILDPFDNQQQKEEVITELPKSVTSSREEKEEEYPESRQTSKEKITVSHEDRESLDVKGADTSLYKIDDDIRSYNLDGFKDTTLKFTSSSKFLHDKSSIRKRLDWSDDTLFLEKHLCPQLIRGLAETAVRRPTNPISFLAHWLYKDYQNREEAEQEAVYKEHCQLERTMCDVQRPGDLVPKKFNLKKYPVKKVPSTISEKASESLRGSIVQNEIEQEA